MINSDGHSIIPFRLTALPARKKRKENNNNSNNNKNRAITTKLMSARRTSERNTMST